MKKICLLFLIIFIIPFKVNALSASSAIAMDLDNGRVLYGYNLDDKRLIASITKIMTAIITIEYSDIDKEIIVGEEVLEAYGSAIYIEVGEKITLRDLLYGLMLRSGNDAAVVIAKNVAGSMDGFALLMNEMASKLGMKNTYFYNDHGLENEDGKGNLSTVRDMAILTKYAMENDTFKEIFGTKKHVVKTNYKTYSWTNKNKLLHSEDYITGGKTGFTEKARRTLVTTGSRNNINVVVVTLNDGNDWADHKSLYADVFRNYEAVKVLGKERVKIKGERIYKNDYLYLDEDIYVPVKASEKNQIRIEYELYKNKEYQSNDVVGHALIYIGKECIRKENIYVKKRSEKEKESWWDRFLRWIKW